MTYQVLARKYRPQRFEDVVGQHGVTQTLRNALAKAHLAQAFVFAGPRGVGKTTTARILARALNCVSGPTPDPCGTCDACVEIAGGRDIDVLELDAATHTQVENVREVIIAGLAMAPVRNRYKVFIIDEVHQLSSHSFNALLKSIEEPPPHVMFMMATTQLEKIPETILSRSQVYEFRTIGRQIIADTLHAIADAEKIEIDTSAVDLMARAADGSMRDAQSAFDQVIAFAGETISAEDVSTVLGLIGRDPVLDAVEVVANEDPTVVFELAGRFVEAGYDLRLVCRELSRAIRDLLVISIDPERAKDREIAAEGERNRLVTLAKRFSREDLMRAFDVVARAEREIHNAAQPRYHLEMALLRWMHLRKLVPLTELLEGMTGQAATRGVTRSAPSGPTSPVASASRTKQTKTARNSTTSKQVSRPNTPLPEGAARNSTTNKQASRPNTPSPEGGDAKAAILAEVKRTKKFFYGTVVAQAQRIDLVGDRLTFIFTQAQRTLAAQLEQNRSWLEATAFSVAGQKLTVAAEQSGSDSQSLPPSAHNLTDQNLDLRAKAMNDSVVKAMLEVFPAEIDSVEKLEP